MEFKEIDAPEGIVQQIDEESFAEITVDVGHGDYIYQCQPRFAI